MTGSRVRPLGAVAAAAVVLWAISATAQTTESPASPAAPAETRQSGPAVEAPRQLVPRALAPRRDPAAPPGPARTAPNAGADEAGKTGIAAEGLSTIDSESVGVLFPRDGGLGGAMWRGIGRAEAVAMVEAIPGGFAYAALRDLASRLLLSRAEAPIAETPDAPSLLAARIRALLDIGDIEGAELLLSVAPGQGRAPDLDAADALLNIFKFDNARACGLARNNQDRADTDFWQRLLIYCDALDGDAKKVAFGLSLLRETGGDDPAMALLTDAILSETQVTLDTIAQPKPIHLALSRAARAELPLDFAESNDPAVLYGAMLAPNLALGGRIEAAERAAVMGAVDPEDLRGLYAQVPYDPADLDDALTRADEIGGTAARALLFQAASAQNIPVARAEIVSAALRIAREDGRYTAAALAFRPLIDRLPPSPEMVWFALTGVRAYLALGEPVGADRWLALLRAGAAVRDDNRQALNRVRPLVRLLGAGDRSADLETVLSAWRDSFDDPAAPGAERLALVNGMFMALGETVPGSAWPARLSGGVQPQPMPEPALWFAFRDRMRTLEGQKAVPARSTAALGAVARVGISEPGLDRPPGIAAPAILALRVMGGGGPDTRGLAVIYEVVAAFRELGLERTARRLAVETLLAAGL